MGGGYLLSQSDSSTPETPRDDVTISSAGIYDAPAGINTNRDVEGDVLPAIDLSTTSGETVSTSELVGTPLILNVWSVTCEPCRKELPAFASVSREFSGRVRVVGINAGDSANAAEEFAEKYGLTYESLRDTDGEFMARLGVSGFPYTLFVDADGTIVAQKGIGLSAEAIRTTILESLLPS